VEIVLGDHERARRLMEEFFTLNLEQRSEAFPYLVRALVTREEDHALAEEQTVLPVLSAELDDARRKEVGARYRTAEEHAPTHAHPRAQHLAPVVKTGGVVDRVRDVVTLRSAPRVRRALRTRDVGALLRRPPRRPHRG